MYVDQNDFKAIKSREAKMAKRFGMEVEPPTMVDLEYGFVPTNVSQSAKGGSSNVKKASEMNLKRFDYSK